MSSEEIKVRIFKYPDRKNLVMRYDDPITGKPVTRSAGTDSEAKAIGNAAVWQDELNTGRYQAASKVTWQQFVDQYTDEKLSTLAPHTKETALASLGHMKRVIGPDRLCKITAAVLSKFAAKLRKPQTVKRGDQERTKPGLSEATIAHHLRHVKAALRWAETVGMLAKAPKVEMPKRAKGQSQARSRAVTTEEYERLLTVTPKVRPKDSATWTRLVEGLWLSGLRLGEGVALSWDEGTPFAVDMLGKRPVFRIRSEGQKSGRDEVLPMTPDFADFLLQTPEAERTGRVFMLTCPATGKPIARNAVGRIIGDIGRRAKVVTNKADGKFASAHDLRRAFGTRWAKRVMPAILQRLMRHSAIQTTMSYYVDLDAAEVADELWAKFSSSEGNNAALGNTLGNSRPKTAKATERSHAGQSPEVVEEKEVAN